MSFYLVPIPPSTVRTKKQIKKKRTIKLTYMDRKNKTKKTHTHTDEEVTSYKEKKN